MIGALFTLFAAAAAFPGAARDAAPSACKLTPFDADWPSHAEWTALNKSIGGALIETRPSASSCYLGNPFDSSLNCKTVESNWTQAAFHADLPESIGSPVYANNSCLPPGATGYTNSSGCHLGGYPSYVVNATSDKQIAEAARWASKRNIRIVVKGTGHDLAGRYSLPIPHALMQIKDPNC